MLGAEATSMAESGAKTCVRFAHVLSLSSSGLSQGFVALLFAISNHQMCVVLHWKSGGLHFPVCDIDRMPFYRLSQETKAFWSHWTNGPFGLMVFKWPIIKLSIFSHFIRFWTKNKIKCVKLNKSLNLFITVFYIELHFIPHLDLNQILNFWKLNKILFSKFTTLLYVQFLEFNLLHENGC